MPAETKKSLQTAESLRLFIERARNRRRHPVVVVKGVAK